MKGSQTSQPPCSPAFFTKNIWTEFNTLMKLFSPLVHQKLLSTFLFYHLAFVPLFAVGMAMWKKLLIPGIIILGVSSLVMVGFVLFIRSRRGRNTYSPPDTQASYVFE